MGQVIYQTTELFFSIIMLLILVRIIMSWLPQLRATQIGEVVMNLTEPILAPFQRLIPPVGMLDISPMIAIVTLAVLQQILLTVISAVFNLTAQ